MTDQEPTEADDEHGEVETYTITATRTWEVDLTQAQVSGMKREQMSLDDADAIEDTFLQRELDFIEPEEKLLGVDVFASSDD